jgi:hypothetical protein
VDVVISLQLHLGASADQIESDANEYLGRQIPRQACLFRPDVTGVCIPANRNGKVDAAWALEVKLPFEIWNVTITADQCVEAA